MSEEFGHLVPAHRGGAALSTAERVRLVRADRWIGYPRAELVLGRMADLLDHPPRDRMPCLLVQGVTGMGKTQIVRKFAREHPPSYDRRTSTTSQPVVCFQMPPHPDEKAFWTELLAAVSAPTRSLTTVVELQRAARDMLVMVGARMLVIDEVHSLLACSYRAQRILLNTLKFLATDLRIPLVCVGTADARRALVTDQQLADRFEAIELPRWVDDTSFHRLLASYAASFPLRQRSDLTAAALRHRILDLTQGVLVRIARLLETLAADAIRSGRERIEAADLDTAPAFAPLLSMTTGDTSREPANGAG